MYFHGAELVVEEHREMEAVARRLCARFPHVLPSDVHARVATAWAMFDRAPVREYVPVLVERAVTQELQAVVHRGDAGDRDGEAVRVES